MCSTNRNKMMVYYIEYKILCAVPIQMENNTLNMAEIGQLVMILKVWTFEFQRIGSWGRNCVTIDI